MPSAGSRRLEECARVLPQPEVRLRCGVVGAGPHRLEPGAWTNAGEGVPPRLGGERIDPSTSA